MKKGEDLVRRQHYFYGDQREWGWLQVGKAVQVGKDYEVEA